MSAQLDAVLNAVEGARPSGKGYVAKCPSHSDRSPSLSIAEGDDGRVLLHCFGGCETVQILGSIGLEMSDLFPQSDKPRRPSLGVPRTAFLRAVEHEATILFFVQNDRKKGKVISEVDQSREKLASERVALARGALHGR